MKAYTDTPIRVRYAETDQMRVAYYGNYFTWFEIGRVELCRQRGLEYKRMEEEDGLFLVVVEASCRYVRPARYDDLLTIRTWVAEARRRAIRFGYEVLNHGSGERIATGETLHMICDRLGRPRSLPEKFQALFPGNVAEASSDAQGKSVR